MKKDIIKEIIIILLLTLAIILILGVLLYEFVPTNKIIPEQVSYTTPENVREDLQAAENAGDDNIVVTYQINSTDLSNYKKINEYVPGKKNPFESVESNETTEDGSTDTSNSQGGTTSENTTGSSTDTKTNTNTSSNSGTSYLPDKGTK